MRPFDEVVDRLTGRLKGDPELRAEVGNELKGHLEQSAKEFVAAGRSEEEAWGEAVRAMGEEREVAEGLWEGNKKRISRRRVGRWVVGGTLVPVAGVVGVSLAWGAVMSVAMMVAMLAYVGEGMKPLAKKIERGVRASAVEGMSAEGRRVFEADGFVRGERLMNAGEMEAEVGKARELAEAHAGDKVFWANYVEQLLYAGVADWGKAGAVINPAKVERLMEAVAAGERLEPGNGFYPLAKAAALLNASTRVRGVAEGKLSGVKYRDRFGKVREVRLKEFDVTDRALYERGLAAMVEAAGRAYIDTHGREFAEARLAALPRPTRLADEVLRGVEGMRWWEPHTAMSSLAAERVGAEAVRLAREGNVAEARRLVGAQRAVARMMAEGAKQMIDWDTAKQMYGRALGQEAVVSELAGDAAGGAKAIEKLEEYQKGYGWGNLTRREIADMLQRAGMIDRYFIAVGTDPRLVDVRPEREAEYAVLDQVGAAWWVMVLMGAAVWQGLAAVAYRVRRGKWPAVVFVGWGRLARVVGVSVGVPVVVYAVYAYALGSGRELGARMGMDRLAVEYATVGCGMAVLLRVLGDRALRRRAREIGVEDWGAAGVGRMRVCVGVVLAAAVVAYLVWWFEGVRYVKDVSSPTGGWGYLLGAVVAGYGVSWLAGGVGRGRRGVRAWVGPVVVGGMLAAFTWLVTSEYSYAVATELTGGAVGLFAAVAVVALVMAAVYGVKKGWGGDLAGGAFGRGLSLAPVMLAAAVVMGLAVGVAGRAKERTAVAEMEATGAGFRAGHEVENRGDHTAVEMMRAWRGEEGV